MSTSRRLKLVLINDTHILNKINIKITCRFITRSAKNVKVYSEVLNEKEEKTEN
jgi:hypothetical protein